MNLPILSTLLSAAIAGVFSAVISGAVAWFTARSAIRSERSKRQSELALQIAQLVSARDKDVRRDAMRRFAVGILKVVEPKDSELRGRVFFVPMNSRVTMGREDDNDIVLEGEGDVSRWHAGFIADQHNVWLDDYASKNGTKVQGKRVGNTRLLQHGDKIEIGSYELVFCAIRENTILSQ